MVSEYLNQTVSYYLQYVLPQNLISKWVVAAAVLVLFFVLSKLFVFIIQKVVVGLTSKTKTSLDDLLVDKTNKPISWLLIFVGIRIALEFLALENGFAVYLTKANNSLIYFSVIFLAIAVIVAFIDHWGYKFAKKSKSKLDDILVPLFRKFVYVIGAIAMAVFILDLWGINIAGLLAGVGIAGLALGFAVKDSLANIFGGISLIVSKTFHVGDKIEVESVIGVVQEVGIRATRIRTFDNEMYIIPNGVMANSILRNYHQPASISRVQLPFGVEYGSDPEKVKKVVIEAVKKMKGIEKEPAPDVIFDQMADFSLNFKLRFWVPTVDDVYPKKWEANGLIYNALNKAKIGIPFPTRTVYMHKGK